MIVIHIRFLNTPGFFTVYKYNDQGKQMTFVACIGALAGSVRKCGSGPIRQCE